MPFKTNKNAEEKLVFSKSELDEYLKSERSSTEREIEERAVTMLADSEIIRKNKKKK